MYQQDKCQHPFSTIQSCPIAYIIIANQSCFKADNYILTLIMS
jgi:hypothetical protein